MFHKHNYRSCLPLYLNAHHRPFWNIFLLFKFFTFNHFKYDLLVFSGGVHCIFDNGSFDIKNSFMQYKNGDSYFPWKLRARRSSDSHAVGNLSPALLPSRLLQAASSRLNARGGLSPALEWTDLPGICFPGTWHVLSSSRSSSSFSWSTVSSLTPLNMLLCCIRSVLVTRAAHRLSVTCLYVVPPLRVFFCDLLETTRFLFLYPVRTAASQWRPWAVAFSRGGARAPFWPRACCLFDLRRSTSQSTVPLHPETRLPGYFKEKVGWWIYNAQPIPYQRVSYWC